SGERFHWIAVKTGKAEDRVAGVVFLLTPDELAAADVYEAEEYARVEEAFESGAKAWVYVKP
ncbi:MAG TPA: gamma-glutamylcyclotransferase, partial [Terricaulis sp.]|nr:gamma-glutamylcyclotransferase [Terricaulis sp.]